MDMRTSPMEELMKLRPMPRRLVISYAHAEAYAPLARAVLAKMGFWVVPAEEIEDLPPSYKDRRPELRIVDERRLGEVPDDLEEDGPPVPMIVLAGRGGVTGADSRIVGAVRRPAGLHDLYRLIQEALEETPRSTPRVPTHITAHCRRNGQEWKASMLSLSENGCLLRTPEPVPLGTQVELSFPLPKAGLIVTEAEVAYQLVPDFGLVFHSTPAASRESILAYVTEILAAS
jgi:hypothetical protein